MSSSRNPRELVNHPATLQDIVDLVITNLTNFTDEELDRLSTLTGFELMDREEKEYMKTNPPEINT
jgi:hypothetical protein